MNYHNHEFMGVINITPNSFSDGGLFNNHETLKQRIDFLREQGCLVFDFGAESTAPFNDPLESAEEMARYQEIFFPVMKDYLHLSELTISIDTYRPHCFEMVYGFLKENGFTGNIIWNDVSGVYDDDLFQFLKHSVPDALYIFSHTGISKREHTSDHMKYLVSTYEQELVSDIKAYFMSFISQVKKFNLEKRIILDPCFGFSKNAQQNYFLINHIRDVFIDTDIPLCLGVSRKSFLKALVLNNEDTLTHSQQLEALTADVVAHFIKKLPQHKVYHRLHNPFTFAFSLQKLTFV